MTAYELMIRANRYLIRGGELTPSQKERAADILLAARSTPEQAGRFYAGLRFPGNIDGQGRRMYPAFFIPPWNGGKKLKTFYNQRPKTHIFSANMYELEILRLLVLLAPDRPETKRLAAETLDRLKTTCFGAGDDGVGECFDSSLVVLRFLAAAAPGDEAWIEGRIDNYRRHADEKKRPWYAKWYFWLCLSELPLLFAEREFARDRDEILPWLEGRSAVMNSDHDREVHPVLLCSLKNLAGRLPGYEYAVRLALVVGEKDGRLRLGDPKDGTKAVALPFSPTLADRK